VSSVAAEFYSKATPVSPKAPASPEVVGAQITVDDILKMTHCVITYI